MPNDRDFGHLKARLRVKDHIYTIRKFVRLIASIRNIEKVQVVQPNDILNITRWWLSVFKKNCAALKTLGRKVPRGQKVAFQITNYMQFTYYKDGVIYAQPFIGGLQRYDFELLLKTQPSEILFLFLRNVKKKPLNKDKMKEFLKFERFIPQTRYIQKFRKGIFKWNTYLCII